MLFRLNLQVEMAEVVDHRRADDLDGPDQQRLRIGGVDLGDVHPFVDVVAALGGRRRHGRVRAMENRLTAFQLLISLD